MTEDFCKQLRKDFDDLSENPRDADNFFSHLLSRKGFLRYLFVLEYILDILQSHNPIKFQIIHKGTPFYILAVESNNIQNQR